MIGIWATVVFTVLLLLIFTGFAVEFLNKRFQIKSKSNSREAIYEFGFGALGLFAAEIWCILRLVAEGTFSVSVAASFSFAVLCALAGIYQATLFYKRSRAVPSE